MKGERGESVFVCFSKIFSTTFYLKTNTYRENVEFTVYIKNY